LSQDDALVFVVISLNNKPRLLELIFSALILDFVDEPRIKNTYSLWHVRSRGDRKYALFEKASDFGLTGILVLRVFL